MLKNECLKLVTDGIKKAVENGTFANMSEKDIPEFRVEVPKNRDFGDFAINVSCLSRYTKKSPLETAKEILKNLSPESENPTETKETEIFNISLAGGYINFKIKKDALCSSLNDSIKEILVQKLNYAKNNIGKNEKVMIEYVSANPTGPFHIGHGRWAAVGSALANVMKLCGYDVYQEFYVNDAGNQINNLGRSLYIRVMQQKGIKIDFPQDEEQVKSYYTGDYLIECAEKFIEENSELADKMAKENLPQADDETHKKLCLFAKFYMLDKQKALLEKFETHFDNFFLETSLHERGLVQKCLDELQNNGKLYEQDGALWFKSSEYGDEKDRVIKKTDGAYTYLTSDIAYHHDKFNRGFSKLIDIWGADHHGYIPRMKASIEALGNNPDALIVLLGQLVNLSIKGEQVRMGKRTKMITLDDLIDEVGVDATRFWMIMRNIDTTLEFDVELAKSQTDENPVFYVQYAHARACSILRNAVAERHDTTENKVLPPMFTQQELDNYFDNIKDENLDILWQNNEETEELKMLIEKLTEYKTVVINVAQNYSPYLLTKYLKELAASFHKFYSAVRILSEDKELSKAKLSLVKAVIYVLKSGLTLIGASAPEKM
ncbi:MAG: arginine--tRNA ligase [Candidatus Gastranaerophilales bacterium]|nr:arginine--tRNA ligase [Candidatus Gastranaerophilales bacterium]